MQRNIAITVALVIVLGILVVSNSSEVSLSRDGRNQLFSGLTLPLTNRIPSLTETFTVTTAWSTFQNYLKFAKAHDLEGVSSLSYQISEACLNSEKREECNRLMDSVYLIGEEFQFEDFTNVFYDDKQIVMTTDYLTVFEGSDPAKIVLYFVKSESGEPKVLGIRFCHGTENTNNVCVITDEKNRDRDQNGWWDDVEALFYSKN